MVTERRQVRLSTRGRRSGEPRTVTLFAFVDGKNLVVVGSAGGAARHPAWALNLRDSPAAEVLDGSEQRAVQAHEAAGPERERLWEMVPAVRQLPATHRPDAAAVRAGARPPTRRGPRSGSAGRGCPGRTAP